MSSQKKTLVWDEANLEETSKERGTRQKIDEPDTPYHHPGDYSVSSDSERQEEWSEDSKDESITKHSVWDQLQLKLEEEKKLQDEGNELVVPGWQEKEEKRKKFIEKRKTHYNEGQKWKEMKANPNTNQINDVVEEDVMERENGKSNKRAAPQSETQIQPPIKKQKY